MFTVALRRLAIVLVATPFVAGPATAVGPVQVMIELDGAPVARVFAEARSRGSRAAAGEAARRRLSEIDAAQLRLAARLSSAPVGARELYRVQRVYNGIAVVVDGDQLAALRRFPGVRAVHPIIPKHRANSTSVPFLGTAGVWDGAGPGLTGAGVTIGIVDTGVDYLHTAFGGSGVAGDYAANDTTVLDGFFPTVKVAGGFDFAGDAYDASSTDPGAMTPAPDPDPMDCDGHGTHVAATAGGFGVEAGGATFAGPWDDATPFGSLAIGPGVAPEATIYALRVFGCSGTTAVVEQALEWAVDPDGDGDLSDHLDVVNLSLASAYGSADDPTAVAADNAALAGVVVVAAAGNDLDGYFVVGSPASAGRAVAVAASWDPDPVFTARAVRVDAPPSIAGAHQAGGANFGPALVDPGVSGEVVRADPADACTPLLNPAAEIDGKIALVDRSAGCTAVTQVRQAQEAGTIGAAGVVLIHDAPGLAGVFDDGTGGDITIPPLLVRPEAGAEIAAALDGGSVEVTLTPILLADVFALFSSRGPRRGTDGELALKPDVAAPGVAITSARPGDAGAGGTGAMILSGTSMATPHVAGLAALLRQRLPAATVAELKALVVNTASDVTFDPEATPPVMSPSRMGAGRIGPAAAATATVVAYDQASPERVGVSFGAIEASADASLERVIELRDLGGATTTYDVTVRELVSVSGVAVSLPDGPSVVLPAAGTADLRLRLDVTVGDLRHGHDPTLDEVALGAERHWLTETAGLVVLTPSIASPPVEPVELRVPFYAAVRPASEMAATAPLGVGSDHTGVATLTLAGRHVDTGPAPPLDVVSQVTPLELQAVDPVDMALPAATDLRQIGVASDLAGQASLSEAELFFGVATRGDWATPNAARIEVRIDVDRDGETDFALRNGDVGGFSFGFAGDAFAAVLEDLEGGTETLQGPINGISPAVLGSVPFVTNILVLPVRAADLGLTDGGSDFDYVVRSAAAAEGGAIATFAGPTPERLGGPPPFAPPADESAVLTWDPAAPGLDFAAGAPGALLRPDLDGASFPVEFDLGAFTGHGSLGVLLLHHHNARGSRAEAVSLVGERPDLVLAQTATAPTVHPGGRATFAVSVSNSGPVAAPDVVLADVLPAGTTFSATFSDPACAEVAGTVTCELGELSAAAEVELTLALNIDPGVTLGTVFEHRLDVSTSALEVDPLDNHSSVDVLVAAVAADLRVRKSDGVAVAMPGDELAYDVTVDNLGPGTVFGVALGDAFPPELGLVSWTCTAEAGALCAAAGVGDLDLALDLPAGGRVVVTAIAGIDPETAPTVLVNTAEVVLPPAVIDPSPGDLSATDLTAVEIEPPVLVDGFETGDTSRWE